MPKNKTYSAVIIANEKPVDVYILKRGSPTLEHIWCQIGGTIEDSCSKTFTESELSNIKIKE